MQSIYKNPTNEYYISKTQKDANDIKIIDISYNIIGSFAYCVIDEKNQIKSPIISSKTSLMMWCRTNLEYDKSKIIGKNSDIEFAFVMNNNYKILKIIVE